MVDFERDEGLPGILRRGDLGVLALGAALLLAGWMVRSGQVDRTELHRFAGLSLETPAGWISLPDIGAEGKPRVLTDVLVSDTFKPRVTVSSERLPPAFKEQELSSYVEINLQGALSLFHRIKIRALTLGKRRAVRVDYAYALNPSALPDEPAATDVPVAVRASTLAVLTQGRLLRVDLEQSVAQHRDSPGLANRVLASVKVGRR
jgi:hypothetical protein